MFSTSGWIGFGYWKKTSGSGSGITDGYDGKVIELLKLSKSSDEKSDYFRFSWNATRVLLWFLSRSFLSSPPSLKSGRHYLHLIKISGLLTAEKVWHKRIDNFDNCQFQGSLVQHGSWEGRQVFGSSLSCSSSPHLRVVEAKHLWNGRHERRKNGKTSDWGSRLCFEVTKMWLFRKFHLNFALYLPWLVHLFRSCSWRRRLNMLRERCK